MLFFALTLLACGIRGQGLSPELAVVRDVRFEGNSGTFGGISDYNLRSAMEQGESPLGWRLNPTRRAVALDRDTLAQDAYRIETWYAHHGYFDARFLGWEVQSRPRRRGRPQAVVLVGHVAEGEPSLVSQITWEEVTADGQVHPLEEDGPLFTLIQRRAALQLKDVFSLEAHQDTAELTLSRLRDQGYARATVEGSVDVWPEEHRVEVRYRCQRGEACRFGEVTVQGVEQLPRALIYDAISIKPNKRFSASELARTQRDLFALGAFSVVNVVPDLGESGDPTVVPVRVELEESRWRQLRLGGGVALSNGEQDIHTSVDFRHVNLWNRLWRLDASARGGYAWLLRAEDLVATDAEQAATAEERLSGGPVAALSLGVGIPRFPARSWRLDTTVTGEVGVEDAFQTATLTFGPALTWRPGGAVTLALSLQGELVDYFNSLLGPEDLAAAVDSLDFSDPYRLVTATETLIYDTRNDPLYVTRGNYASITLGEAGPPGDYDYAKVEVDGRFFRPVGDFTDNFLDWRPDAVLAGRMGGGLIVPVSLVDPSRARVPYGERLTLGGSNTVRGWIDGHLGPYLYTDADGNVSPSDPTVAVCASARTCPGDSLAIGGLMSMYGSLELRATFQEDYGVVAFVDAGMAWDQAIEILLLPPIPSAGLGLRYRSPVGPVRLDVASRLTNPPMLRHEPRVQVYFSLSEAF